MIHKAQNDYQFILFRQFTTLTIISILIITAYILHTTFLLHNFTILHFYFIIEAGRSNANSRWDILVRKIGDASGMV